MSKFRTILADPPWQYGNSVGWKGRHGSADHYAVLSASDICDLPVREIAESNSVILLWCTWAKLKDGIKVIESWGFEYTTGFPWIKVDDLQRKSRAGVGFHTRSLSEFILIGKRGSCCPVPAARLDGLIICKGGRHSAKPEAQYDFAEAYGGPFLEIFARPDGGLFPVREGWTRIGNEITGRDVTLDLRDLANDVPLPVWNGGKL